MKMSVMERIKSAPKKRAVLNLYQVAELDIEVTSEFRK